MQQQDKVIDVRGVLERNCTTTSVDELRSQGRSRVKVINAKQISALIEEAVARAIEARRSSSTVDTNALIEASRVEFQNLVAEREQELREVRAEKAAVEQEREALRSEVAEKQALEETVQRAREELQRVLGSPALEDLEQVLRGFAERERSEEAQRAEALHRELEELDAQSRELAQRLEQCSRERDEARRAQQHAEAALAALQAERDAAANALEHERETLRQEVGEKRALEDTVQQARGELQRVLSSPTLEDLENVLRRFAEHERSKGQRRAETMSRGGTAGEVARELDERGRMEQELAATRGELEEARRALQRERADLESQLHELGSRQDAVRGAEAASNQAMSAILAELRQLKDTVEKAPVAAPQAPALDASKMMESLGEAMEKKLDKLGRKLGMGSGPEVASGISFDGLFASSSTMESNLEQVEVKEREGGSIQDAVARMKAMRLKASQGDS
jgi:chromosome segregation ATPase